MFEVLINDGKNEIPDNPGISYVIGKNGMFIKKKIGVVDSLTPVSQISVLEDVTPYVDMNLPKIKQRDFEEVVEFFRQAYNKHSSEAMVLIYLNTDTNSISFKAPKQEVTGASIDYKSIVVDDNFMLVGSIHSHGSMSAFHSGVDVNDENDFDGLHITVGNVTRPDSFSLSAEYSVGGVRSVAEDYVEGLISITEKIPINIPVNKIKSNNTYNCTLNNYQIFGSSHFQKLNQNFHATIRNEKFMKFEKPLLEEGWTNEEWLSNVTKKTYAMVARKYTPHHNFYNDDYYNWYAGYGSADTKNKDNIKLDQKDKTSKKENKLQNHYFPDPTIHEDDTDWLELLICELGNPTMPCANCVYAYELEYFVSELLNLDTNTNPNLRSIVDEINTEYIDYESDDKEFDATTADIDWEENPLGNNPEILKAASKTKKGRRA